MINIIIYIYIHTYNKAPEDYKHINPPTSIPRAIHHSPAGEPGPLSPPLPSPVRFPCRVRREELPRGAQLCGPGERRARHPALGLRVRGAEMLGVLAALRARPPLAPHQREAAGGARQDQSGRCERGCRAAEGLCGSAGG